MRKWYEVVFYSGDAPIPAYYVVDTFQAETIGLFKQRLDSVIQRVRKMFHITAHIPDYKITKLMYVVSEDGLVAIKEIN